MGEGLMVRAEDTGGCVLLGFFKKKKKKIFLSALMFPLSSRTFHLGVCGHLRSDLQEAPRHNNQDRPLDTVLRAAQVACWGP